MQTAGPIEVGVDEIAQEFSTAHLGVQGNCQFIPARSLTAKPHPCSIWASLLEMCTFCPWGNEKFKCQNKCTVLQFKIHTKLLYPSHLPFLLEVARPCSDQFISELLWKIIFKGFPSLCVFQKSSNVFCAGFLLPALHTGEGNSMKVH